MISAEPKSAVFGTPADLRRSLAVGLGVGLLSAISTFIRYSRPILFAHRRGDPLIVSAACLAGALVAGAVFGALRPITRKLSVASAIAFLAGFPVIVALDATRNTPRHPPGVVHWLPDIGFTVVAAIVAALFYRRRTADKTT